MFDPDRSHWKRLYLSVGWKFAVALAIAASWAAFSIYVSQRWLSDLASVVGWGMAILIIGFIAYIPGFMNAFLVSSLLLDRRPPFKRGESCPGVTVLVAAYNEASGIADTLTSLALQDYAGPLEVLILNDGSKDETAARVRETLRVLPIRPHAVFRFMDFAQNRGKSAVLNDGLRAASHELVATIDGDCWVKRDGIANIVRRMLSDPPDTEAVAGAVMVRNSRRNLLTRTQEWDYFHGIAAVKRMQGMYHGTLVAQGAFSLYRRSSLLEVGGWPECVGDDIVVSWALLAQGYRIGYAPNAFAFTNVPESLRQFAMQRKRWSRGLMEAFKVHWPLLFQARMSMLFIWWNVFFVPLDLVYTFAFIPGLMLALLGHYYIAGPLTLLVLPLVMLCNLIIFRIQSSTFHAEELKVRYNPAGFLFFSLAYSLLMQPVCVWGYFAEILGMRKAWDTK